MIWSIPTARGFGNTYEEGWGNCQGNSRIHDLNTSHRQGRWTYSKREQYTSLLSLCIKFSAVLAPVFFFFFQFCRDVPLDFDLKRLNFPGKLYRPIFQFYFLVHDILIEISFKFSDVPTKDSESISETFILWWGWLDLKEMRSDSTEAWYRNARYNLLRPFVHL